MQKRETQIPSSWVNAKLEDVCEILDSMRVPVNNAERAARTTGKSKDELFPYYGATGQVGTIDDYIFDGEFVLLGEDGAPFLDPTRDKAYLASGKFWVNNHAHILEAHVSNKYLCYWLNHIEYGDHVTGTTRLKLTQAALKKMPIPFAPEKEQARIVTKIEKLFSELDKGVENLTSARTQLDAYRQSVLKHAFDGTLADLRSSRDWQHTSLGEQISYLTSGSRGWAKYYSEDGDLFIRAQNLKHDRLDLADQAYVSLPPNAEGTRTRVEVGDVLITITGANVTKTAYVKTDLGIAYVSQHVALLRPVETCNSDFLYWLLVAEAHGRKQLSDFAYGAGKPGLNLDNIRSVKFRLPPPEIQASIVQIIDRLLSQQERMREIIENELDRLDALRQAILKEAFLGKLARHDPSDEPASVLLERIKRERKAMNNHKSRKHEEAA